MVHRANHEFRDRGEGVSILATSFFRDTFARAHYEDQSLVLDDRARFLLAAVDDVVVAAPFEDIRDCENVRRDEEWQELLGDWVGAGLSIGRITEARPSRYGDGIELLLGEPSLDVKGFAVGTMADLDVVPLADGSRLLFVSVHDGRDVEEYAAFEAIAHRVADEA